MKLEITVQAQELELGINLEIWECSQVAKANLSGLSHI